MDATILLHALILGIVEGLTEFLPVSSTGHLILVGDLLHFNDEKGKVFEIVIQFGAILAVAWEYRARIASLLLALPGERAAQRFFLNLGIAFLPLAVLGLLFHRAIKAHLFQAIPVALAFIVGGILILWAERRPHLVRIDAVEELRPIDALWLGAAQALALIPGTSRSGATIIGGLFLGLSRRAATEFSFFLALPTLTAATCYQAYRERALFSVADIPMLALGFVAAFASAIVCVRWLLAYISSHDFVPFAWYRVGFGLLVIASWQQGWIDWTQS